MLFLVYIFILVLNIEAVTNIISKSELFKPARMGLFNLSNGRGVIAKIAGLLHDLMDCPYCTSVWVSAFYLVCVYISANSILFLFFCAVISLHRLSNVLHFVIDRIDGNHSL